LPNAGFVIEGYVDPTEPLRDEGPFNDHTGYYKVGAGAPTLGFGLQRIDDMASLLKCGGSAQSHVGYFSNLGNAGFI
jgi:3-octaprenyl-4-hydroxybenzoate carboxy-lyase Rift-related domain